MSGPSPEQVRAEADARVRRALVLIERAQNDLASACGELSALVGGIPVWNACGKLTDRVRAYWYRVDRFRSGGRFKLDDIHTEALARRLDADYDAKLQRDEEAHNARLDGEERDRAERDGGAICHNPDDDLRGMER